MSGLRKTAYSCGLNGNSGMRALPTTVSRKLSQHNGGRRTLGGLLQTVGIGWLEWILHTDPGVLLTGVEILREEHSTANLGGAADDHRIPERDPGSLMDAYR